MSKPIVTLSDWRVTRKPNDVRLEGVCYGHPAPHRCPDGGTITTSPLLSIDFVAMRAETLNTIYYLSRR